MYKCFGKRLIDILIAGAGFLVLFPFLFLLTTFLYFTSRQNPFFFQSRPGLDGAIFKIVKFRTMRSAKDPHGHDLPDHLRITRIGKILRTTAIDEIPQLYNVLVGDMSIVGPRPLLPEYLPLYTSEEMRRHDVRPGITGWAQIHDEDGLTLLKKCMFDLYYTKNYSLSLDIKIIVLTGKMLFCRVFVNANGRLAQKPLPHTHT